MKKSLLKELKSKSREELIKTVEEERKIFNKEEVLLRARKLKNTSSLREKKKKIARILTTIAEKER